MTRSRSAQIRSCSTTTPPRATFTSTALCFMVWRESRLMSPAVSGVRGQLSETTSDRREQVRRAARSARRAPLPRLRRERSALGIEDRAAEALQEPRDIAADGSEADDADGLARQHEGLVGSRPPRQSPFFSSAWPKAMQRSAANIRPIVNSATGMALLPVVRATFMPQRARGLEIEIVDADAPFVQQLEPSRRAQHLAADARPARRWRNRRRR